jgi:hypothetical protein
MCLSDFSILAVTDWWKFMADVAGWIVSRMLDRWRWTETDDGRIQPKQAE